MIQTALYIEKIPCILWGEASNRVVLHVHGKMSRKEYAAGFAELAAEKGWQTLSFDLPDHGERSGRGEECTPFAAVPELKTLAEHVFAHWEKAALYACSLGACFSLEALADYPFEKALFQSPIVDMSWLIRQMQTWFGVSDERLRAEGRVPTPVDTLRWDWHEHAMNLPGPDWRISTSVLYGGRDNLQSREVVEAFCRRTGAALTVSENSEHPFMAESDAPVVESWIQKSL